MISVRLLIDTNRYRDLVDRKPEITSRVEMSAETWLSLITIGELRYGFALGSRQPSNESRLRQMLGLQGVGVLRPDEETTHFYAKILKQLRTSGRPIPTNDVWIAAQAVQHNLVLDTADRHFQQIDGLRLLDS